MGQVGEEEEGDRRRGEVGGGGGGDRDGEKEERCHGDCSPDWPGGGMPPEPLGNRTKMERTAALFPKQGSRAMGLGMLWRGRSHTLGHAPQNTHHPFHSLFSDLLYGSPGQRGRSEVRGQPALGMWTLGIEPGASRLGLNK